MKTIITNTTEETEEYGAQFAKAILKSQNKYFIAIYGDLGAGKTVFVRGFCAVASPGSRVKSPTYTVVNEYRRGHVPIFHFDLYRITSTDELVGMGFEEYLENGICLAEWSENLGNYLPNNTVKVRFEKIDDTKRKITFEGIEDFDENTCH